MTRKTISYRRARKRDLLPAIRMIETSFNHLRKTRGKDEVDWNVRTVPPLIRHIHATDSDKMYCAWCGKRLVGFGGALLRGKQWYLAWLFVHPQYQDRGVGRTLLEKVWREGKGIVHSLGTFSYNMQAVGIYSRFGIVPEEMLTVMETTKEKVRLTDPSGIETVRDPRPTDFAWINRLEKTIRGYPHAEEWRLWSGEKGYGIAIFKRRGRRIGYCMVDPRGTIGPVGVERAGDMIAVAGESLRLAVEMTESKIAIVCPNSNKKLYTYLLDSGFRNEEILLFMSDASYGDFQRYVPASLAVF